jgi:predicted aspartyl protease
MASSFDRRRLLGAGAAALGFAPSLARAGIEVRFDPTQSASVIDNKIQGKSDSQNRLTVETFINGKGPFHFIVDTGADRSVIASDIAASLGLATGESLLVQGIERAMVAPSVQLSSLRVGHVTIGALQVPVLPRQWLGGDGYLGLDVIDRQSVTFDFQGKALTVAPSDPVGKWVRFDETLIRADGSDGKLTAVNCEVDGLKAYAFIDSGASMSIGNTKLFQAMAASNGSSYIDKLAVTITGVTGGSTTGRLTPVRIVKLGRLAFAHSMLAIADLQVFDMWGLADKPALFIGMNFLQQVSAVTIDYGRKEIRFKTAQIRLASRA